MKIPTNKLQFAIFKNLSSPLIGLKISEMFILKVKTVFFFFCNTTGIELFNSADFSYQGKNDVHFKVLHLLFKSTQKTLNRQFEIEMLQMKKKPYLQFTALHQLNNVIEEHISVPLTKSTHIIWYLQEKNKQHHLYKSIMSCQWAGMYEAVQHLVLKGKKRSNIVNLNVEKLIQF